MILYKFFQKRIKKIGQKNNDLEKSFDQEYKDVLKNQCWSYKFTSESWFKGKFIFKMSIQILKSTKLCVEKYFKSLKSYIKIDNKI